MIICDTREKTNQNVLSYFERHNVNYQVKKVDTGDYVNTDMMGVVVERKKNLNELLTNLCSKKDTSRFWREVRRAKEENIKMIVLCEHGGKIRSIKDVASWKSKYSRVTGKQLMEEIYKVHIAYGVEFLFCDKRSTGKRILELLSYE